MKKEHRELRRRPLLTPLWLFALAGLGFVTAAVWFVASLTTTTVVLVRHAENQLGTIEDPPLSLAGEQRVQALARIFGERSGPGRLAAVFADRSRRTQSTAAPLAARLDLSLSIVPEVDQLLRRISREYRGQNVLVVAQASSLSEIVRRLAGVDILPVADQDSAIYIVTVPTLGRASLLRLTY